jgi:hypothetical protein
MKSRQQQQQGRLTIAEIRLANRMKAHPKAWFSTLRICQILRCASARDRVRKMKANGVKVGRARYLYTSPTGAKVYGWRMG